MEDMARRDVDIFRREPMPDHRVRTAVDDGIGTAVPGVTQALRVDPLLEGSVDGTLTDAGPGDRRDFGKQALRLGDGVPDADDLSRCLLASQAHHDLFGADQAARKARSPQ